MGYGRYYNTSGVIMRDSFAAYVEKFKNTKPIRSKQNADKIPLGNRNKHYMASISMPDENTIHLNFYGHPLVIWKPDDTLEIFPPRYYSAYAVDNIQQFAPRSIHFGWNRSRLTVHHGDKTYLLDSDKSLKFRKIGAESYELVDVPVEYAIRKKRGMEKKFLKDCVPFLDWLDLVQSIDNKPDREANDRNINEGMDAMFVELGFLTNSEFTKWQGTEEGIRDNTRWKQMRMRDHAPHDRSSWRASKGFHTEGCKLLLDWITAPMSDNWVHALYVILHNAGKRVYKDRVMYLELTRTTAEEYIAELVKHVYFEHCFDRVPLGAGEIPTKQNTEYLKTYRLTL